MPSSLTKKAGRSALWQISGGGWTIIVRLGASAFLARALTPQDFGVFGLALLVNGFLNAISILGLGSGIIAKKKVTDFDLCTYFWTMAVFRILMFFVAYLSAPFAGYFFDDMRVSEILRVTSFVFLISIIGVVSGTLLTKELKFKALNVIRGSTVLLESILAVFLTLKTDLGYWALVYAMVLTALLNNLALCFVARWWPKFKYSMESFRYLFSFGIHVLGSSLTNYLRQNLDYLLVGRLLGTTSMGLYEFAYRIPHLIIDRIAGPVGAVVFPALSKVQNDNQLLASGYLKAVKYISLVSFPLIIGLAAVADVAVPVLWGEQWMAVITPLRILCLSAALSIVVQPIGAIFNCKKRPDIPFKLSIILVIWTAIAVGSLGFLYGINGVAIGMVLSVIPGYIGIWIAFKMVATNLRQLWKSLFPVIFSTFVCGFGAYVSSQIFQIYEMGLFVTLFVSIVLGAFLYVLTLYSIFPRFFNDTISLVEEISGSKIVLEGLKRKK